MYIYIYNYKTEGKEETWRGALIMFQVSLSVQLSSVTRLCPTLCDPMNRNMPGLPVHHQLPEFTQTHVHWVSDAIQLSHLLSSPSPPVLNLSQHRGLFKWVSSSHQVSKISLYMFKIFLSLIQQVRVCVCVCVLVMSDSLQPYGILSMEFSRQEYWTGLPFPTALICQLGLNVSCASCIVRQIIYHCAT